MRAYRGPASKTLLEMQALAWSEKATAVLRQPVSGAQEERLQALLLDGSRMRLRLPLLSRLEQRLRSWQWHQEARTALLGMEAASAGMRLSFPGSPARGERGASIGLIPFCSLVTAGQCLLIREPP